MGIYKASARLQVAMRYHSGSTRASCGRRTMLWYGLKACKYCCIELPVVSRSHIRPLAIFVCIFPRTMHNQQPRNSTWNA